MSVRHSQTLLAEDSKPHGTMIYRFLTEELAMPINDIWWAVKFRNIDRRGGECLRRFPDSDREEWISFEWEQFGTIILDGQLGPSPRATDGPHGWYILDLLFGQVGDEANNQKIPVIAITDDAGANEMMIELGARFGAAGKRRRPDSFKATLRGHLRTLGCIP